MGGGAVPTPATTAGNNHAPPLYPPTAPPFSSDFSTGISDFRGAVPTPATTTGNHHSPPLYPPTAPPFPSNFSTGISDFNNESEITAIGYSNQSNFGPVPSQIEVQNAIFDLQRVMNGFCEMNSDISEWNYDCSRSVMKYLGEKRLLDAYHLLQTDPLVQRLVLSISSDALVWDAILKNDAVQNFQGSLSLAETEDKCTTYKHETISTFVIVKWIFEVMKSKIMKVIENLEVFVFKTLHSMSKKMTSTLKHDDEILEEKVGSSLLLSIIILVIVVVTRSIDT